GVEQRIDVDAVVGVLVRDDHRVYVGDADVLLQVRHRARTGVDPEVEPILPDEITAERAALLRPCPARPEDDQLQVAFLLLVATARAAAASSAFTRATGTAATRPTSGPRKWCAIAMKAAGSPVVTNSCWGSPRSSRSTSA